jgi:serine/threonine protein kinase
VYKARWVAMPGDVIAFDLIKLNSENEEWLKKCLKQEMKMSLKLNHKNIIKAYDVMKTRTKAYIFMQFAAKGNIEELLIKTRKSFKESKAKLYFAGILDAIVYIHNRGIAHRDIKLENFLLDENDQALLSDFSFSCQTVAKEFHLNKLMKGTNCGSDLYKAPEVLKLKNGYVYDGKAADIYSLGVCLFEMLYYFKPFGESLNERNTGEFMRRQILDPNPEQRIPATKASEHMWLKE